MTWRLRILTLVLVTSGLLLGGGAAAYAADSPAAAPVPAAAGDGAVTGQQWSAPAQPVKCIRAGGNVSCTPLDSDKTVQTVCYNTVPLGGDFVSVCSSADSNQESLRNVGKELKYEWGCAQTWDVCATMEGTAETLAANAIIAGAKAFQAFQFNTSSLLWSAAVDQWSFWVWAVWIVVIVVGIVAITKAAFSGSPGEVLAAVVRTGLAFPLTQATLWLTGRVVNSVDTLTTSLLGQADPLNRVSDLFFSGGVVFPLGGVLVVGLMLLAEILMLFVLMFRNVALAALVMVGPLAWMLFPMRGIGKEWLVRYFAAFAALLLTGPLMMSLLGMITSGLDAVNSIWEPAVWPFILGLVLLSFAPFAVFSLFSFVGGTAVDQVAAGAMSRVASAARNVTRNVPRPRTGQAPAGRPGPRGPAAARSTAPPAAGRPTGGPAGRPTGGPAGGGPASGGSAGPASPGPSPQGGGPRSSSPTRSGPARPTTPPPAGRTQ
ncbi:hypothetical protein MHK74_11595 [Microbacterium aurum]|uniref:hypothetical protein n=1 Tax=Microbacterium aurum TaxID=36805 RepID=UPI001EF58FA6|nr:hypothetical protein [Microbacterium aurum]MCG7415199.1 hypothetical protein [Microbacterium aurum]